MLSFRLAANAHRATARPPAASGPLPAVLTVAFAPAFGEAGNGGTAPYFLASACQYVYCQPSGMVGFIGMESPAFFVRGLLDRLGVRPVFFTREEYKTAAHMFTQVWGVKGRQRGGGCCKGELHVRCVFSKQRSSACTLHGKLPLPLVTH